MIHWFKANGAVGRSLFAASLWLAAASVPTPVLAASQSTAPLCRGDASRMALLVGNQAYARGLTPLDNPRRDIAAFGKLLCDNGFTVYSYADLGVDAFDAALDSFGQASRDARTAVVYYSGHGFALGGKNWLAPVDADPDCDDITAPDRAVASRLRRKLIDVSDLLGRIAQVHNQIVILDACRTEPVRACTRGGAAPTLVKGFDRVGDDDARRMIVYATQNGAPALDHTSGSDTSPMMTAITARLSAEPWRNWSDAMYGVSEEVYRLTDRRQTPNIDASLRPDGCLARSCEAPKAAAVAPAIDTAQADFAAAMTRATVEGWTVYLGEHGSGALADIGRRERERLRIAALPAVAPVRTESLPVPVPPKPPSPVAPPFVMPKGARLVPQLGHQNPISSVTFSPDGRTALAGTWDQTLQLWDVTSGKLLRTFEGHGDRVHSVAFAPDGRTILSGSDDQTLRLWDVATGTMLRTFVGHHGSVNSVAFAPDGRTALSGGDDSTVRLWDVASGKPLSTFKGSRLIVSAVAFAPDGRTALSGGSDGTMRLWDVASGTLLHAFAASDWVYSVAFTPDGRTALLGSGEGSFKLWDVASGKALRTFKDGGAVMALAVAPNGRTVLSGDAANFAKLWDLTSGKLLRTLDEGDSTIFSVTFAPDGRTALSSSDKTIKFWDVETGALLVTFVGNGRDGLALRPDNTFVATGDPARLLALVRGTEHLPLDGYIAANRRDSFEPAATGIR